MIYKWHSDELIDLSGQVGKRIYYATPPGTIVKNVFGPEIGIVLCITPTSQAYMAFIVTVLWSQEPTPF